MLSFTEMVDSSSEKGSVTGPNYYFSIQRFSKQCEHTQ